MSVIALVPFKSFSYAKKRLRGHYSDVEVEEIGRAMLQDVLTALTSASGLAAVRVLTDDPEVARVAESRGAEARVRTPDRGLNPTIEDANAEAKSQGFDATLIVLGDTPGLRSTDVEHVLRTAREAGVALVPSPDGGTVVLLRRPPDRIPARFGPGSFEAHLRACEGAGVEPIVLDDIDEAHRTDLDTPEDAGRILEGNAPGRTVDVLRRLGAR